MCWEWNNSALLALSWPTPFYVFDVFFFMSMAGLSITSFWIIEVDFVLLLFQYGIPTSGSSDKPCMGLLVFSIVILDIGKVLGCYPMLLYGLRIDLGLLIPQCI